MYRSLHKKPGFIDVTSGPHVRLNESFEIKTNWPTVVEIVSWYETESISYNLDPYLHSNLTSRIFKKTFLPKTWCSTLLGRRGSKLSYISFTDIINMEHITNAPYQLQRGEPLYSLMLYHLWLLPIFLFKAPERTSSLFFLVVKSSVARKKRIPNFLPGKPLWPNALHILCKSIYLTMLSNYREDE